MHILICTSQIPFIHGGTETLTASLKDALRDAGHVVDTVMLPFQWTPRSALLRNALAWRLLDISHFDSTPVDLVIATKFPSYVIRHPRKVVWLVHQHRQAYDWYGTELSDWGSQERDQETRKLLLRIDRRTLSEAHALFTISRNVAARLRQYNGLQAEPLYPPSHLSSALHPGQYGNYLLSPARLDATKRIDLLLEALAASESHIKAIITGDGPERQRLERQARQLNLGERVVFAGYVDNMDLVELYAGCRAVYYAPVDEDYGFATVEAFGSGKAVLTTTDAGGVLEWVKHEVNGIVVAPEGRALAGGIDQLTTEKAQRLGAGNVRAVRSLAWPTVIDALLNNA
ncbi:MAG: glycosyltransferase family 4 protein [Herpetosiphon sp.]